MTTRIVWAEAEDIGFAKEIANNCQLLLIIIQTVLSCLSISIKNDKYLLSAFE